MRRVHAAFGKGRLLPMPRQVEVEMNKIARLKAELAHERSLLDAIGELGLSLVRNEQLTETGWITHWQCNLTVDGDCVTVVGFDIRTTIESAISISKMSFA